MKSGYYNFKFDVIRRNFDKTKSAKFKATLKIISNKNGIIKEWKIFFSELHIDIYTTKSWFKDKNSNFNIRQKLFEKLNLIQEKRPDKNLNKLIELNYDQIKIVNNFFNNRNEYKSTIKNIVGIIKGNNPCGEAKNPQSAEMVLADKNGYEKNFVILLDDLVEKRVNLNEENKWYENDDYDLYEEMSNEINFDEYINLNNVILEAYKFMQREKTLNEFERYLNDIKNYKEKYNTFFDKANTLARKERSKYGPNIKNYYKDNKMKLPFGFKLSDDDIYQKAHIYEVKVIRDKVIQCILDNREILKNKLLKMISDPENFLPLEESHHRKFDKNKFTYDENGKVKIIVTDKFVIDNRYYYIDKNFLTEKRIKYIKMRNELIIK